MNAASEPIRKFYPPPVDPRHPPQPASPSTTCQVPLESLVDSRFIEGTYPLFDSTPPIEDGEEDADPVKKPEGRDPRQQAKQGNRRMRRMSSYNGGLFDPSLELGLHLYRMGPMNSYSITNGGRRDAGNAVGSRVLRSGGTTAGGAGADASRSDQGSDPLPGVALWKPPSLVERGKVGLDGRGSALVSLFARPPAEPTRSGDVGSGGDAGG